MQKYEKLRKLERGGSPVHNFVRWLLCDVLGWHNDKHPDQPEKYFDGASWHARCGRCGKSVMQDSQGNWF